jgi:hypothetical protein
VQPQVAGQAVEEDLLELEEALQEAPGRQRHHQPGDRRQHEQRGEAPAADQLADLLVRGLGAQ